MYNEMFKNYFTNFTFIEDPTICRAGLGTEI